MHWKTIGFIAFAITASSSPVPEPMYLKNKPAERTWAPVGGKVAARSIPSLSLKRSPEDETIDPLVAHISSVNRVVKRHAKRSGIDETHIKKRSVVGAGEWVYVKRDENGIQKRFDGHIGGRKEKREAFLAELSQKVESAGQQIQSGAEALQQIKEQGVSISGDAAIGGGQGISLVGSVGPAGPIKKRQEALAPTTQGTKASSAKATTPDEVTNADIAVSTDLSKQDQENIEMLADPDVKGAEITQNFDPAKKPDTSSNHAIALNEDGTDTIYFSEIKIGSSGKKFTVNMDTGSCDLWVPAAGSISTHSTLAKGDSSTLEVFGDKPFQITYGSGEVSGVLVKDRVDLGGMKLQTTFGAGTKLSQQFNNLPADGILGLGSNLCSQQKVPTPVERLAAAGMIKAPLVGVHMQRAILGNEGVINFGEPDPKLIVGGLKGLNFNDNINKRGQYEVKMDDVTVGGQSLKIPSDSSAIIDTGTTQMLLPPKVANELNSCLSEQAITDNEGTFAVPCDTKTTVTITFGGIDYPVSPSDYIGRKVSTSLFGEGTDMCLTRISAFDLGGNFGENVALFGAVFLKNVYSVYDIANNRVGFGVDKRNNGNLSGVNETMLIERSSGFTEGNSKAVAKSSAAAGPITSLASRKALGVSVAAAVVLGFFL